MTDLDAAGRAPGYYDSPFPGEDGGPRRQLAPRSPGLGIREGERLAVTASRSPGRMPSPGERGASCRLGPPSSPGNGLS